jgi:hypothetical protein
MPDLELHIGGLLGRHEFVIYLKTGDLTRRLRPKRSRPAKEDDRQPCDCSMICGAVVGQALRLPFSIHKRSYLSLLAG